MWLRTCLESWAVLRHANTELGANSFFQRSQINILTRGKLRKVCRHALVHFGITDDDRIAVDTRKKHLFLDQLLEHVIHLLLFRHGGAFGGLLELVKVVHELGTHDGLPVDNRGDTVHQYRSGHGLSHKACKK